MFLRATVRKKDGKEHTYYSVVENKRLADGRVAQRHVLYLDVWERHLRGAIPGEVVAALGHTEANLHPFYDHLEARYESLRKVVQSGRIHARQP
jgi:hypothetical protein